MTSRIVRAYGALLRVFPAPFRRAHGEQMTALFDTMWNERRGRGLFAKVLFLLRTLVDVVIHASGAWLKRARRPGPSIARGSGPRVAWFDAPAHDARMAWRGLMRRPGFTVVAVLLLSIGIGGNTAIFSLVRSAMLSPLPFADPDRLVRVWERRPAQGRDRNVVSLPDYLDWREQNTVFHNIAAYRGQSFNLSGVAQPEQVIGSFVTHDFFATLGVAPHLGRFFTRSEDQPGAPSVVILSHRLWSGRFGADPDIIGSSITLNLALRIVVGVMPPDFEFPFGASLWLPLAGDAERWRRSNHGLNVIARLKGDVTVERAWADMNLIARQLEEQYPEANAGHYAAVYPLHTELLGSSRQALLLVMGAVAFVLLIVCVNVANMQLARGVSREREIGIRAALGATRLRLIHHLFAENLLVGLAAGALSITVSILATQAMQRFVTSDFPWIRDTAPDVLLLAVTCAVSFGALMVFGLLPSWHGSRCNTADSLKEGSRYAAGGVKRHRLRNALVVTQVATALLLLVGAGLAAQSLVKLLQVDPGFESSNVLTARLTLPGARYRSEAARREFYQTLEQRLQGLPGIDAVGISWLLPMTGQNAGSVFTIEGRPPPENMDDMSAHTRIVNQAYFDAMQIAVLQGRGFRKSDGPDGEPVLIVNETMARHYWPGENVLGQRLRMGMRGPPRTIVGIVEDVRHGALAYAPEREMYFPVAQSPPAASALVLRTLVEPTSVVAAVRNELRAVDPDQPLASVVTLDRIVADTVKQPRALALLVGCFAALAVILSAIGVYGVIAFTVGERRREFGVRLALGGSAVTVLRSAMAHGMKLIAIGLAVGIVLAVLLSRTMARLLYNVSPLDLVTFSIATVVLLAIASVANFIPARHATKVNPVESLRTD